MSFDLLAASLRANRDDIHAWVAALSQKLAAALPTQATVRHGGLFGGGAVTGVDIALGSWRYALHLQHGQPVAERVHIVRGIALKTETLTLDTWLDEIARLLAELAATSTREAAALRSLLID